jgi:hypothetical protein
LRVVELDSIDIENMAATNSNPNGSRSIFEFSLPNIRIQ